MMELTARYSLEFNPFLKNSKEILYAGSEYKEALFRLDYLARTKGFGLLTGATLGGNLTPIGASANIAATGLLKKEGYESSFGDFMRIGIPYTLTAVIVGYLYLWIVWA